MVKTDILQRCATSTCSTSKSAAISDVKEISSLTSGKKEADTIKFAFFIPQVE